MAELITISEAAKRVGVKPWEIERLLNDGALRQVVLVDASSLTEYQETK